MPVIRRRKARSQRRVPAYGGVGWIGGNPHDYDREFCVDRAQLAAFLHATQPGGRRIAVAARGRPDARRKFLARLQGEVAKRGTIDVLRHGVKHGAHNLDLFYGTPSAGNPQAQARFEQNRFTVVRQLRYSRDDTQRALDIGLFINGLPVFTFELKNSLTKQTVADAVEQYKKDRNPREKLFEFGRCVAHFAVDESEVRLCTLPQGQGVLVPAVQPGLERRRRQPAQTERHQDRLSVAPSAGPREPDQHPGELRPGGGGEGREDR